MKNKKWMVLLLAAACVSLSACGAVDTNSTLESVERTATAEQAVGTSAAETTAATTAATTTAATTVTTTAATTAATTTAATISVDLEFSSGYYTAGIDFPGGTYDITAVEGGGNVMSDNMYMGGINAVMGTEDKNDLVDMYEQSYSNVSLPDGVTLSISGVTVRLHSDDASSEPLTPRAQENTETVELGNGNFTAGVDFPAGVYDIIAVDGGGNVISSNAYTGGINAVMGTEDKNELVDIYEQEYQNIDLSADTTLSISGVTVRLVPSD